MSTPPDEHDLRGDDFVGHEMSADCPCGPDVEWEDPDTGEPYDFALVIHHSLDDREQREQG